MKVIQRTVAATPEGATADLIEEAKDAQLAKDDAAGQLNASTSAMQAAVAAAEAADLAVYNDLSANGPALYIDESVDPPAYFIATPVEPGTFELNPIRIA